MIMDYRCPACDLPVRGNEPVTNRKPRIHAKECQHCKVELSPKEETTDLGHECYYVIKKGDTHV